MRGRPLSVPGEARSPLARVLWLIRVHRLGHSDSRYRHARTFAPVLSTALGRQISEGRVHQLESAGARSRAFTRRDLSAYEQVLGIEPGALCDFYTWVGRNAGQPVLTRADDDADRSVRDLAAAASYDHSLSPAEWLRVADHCASPSGRELPALQREKIHEALARALAHASGADFRLLREAALRIGQDMGEHLDRAVRDDPSRGYHALETLGGLDAAVALPTLKAVLASPADPWLVRSALESYTQLLGAPGGVVLRRSDDADEHQDLLELGKHYLQDPSHTVRQQAAQLLRVVFRDRDEAYHRLLSLGVRQPDADVQHVVGRPSRERAALVGLLRRSVQASFEVPFEDAALAGALDDALFEPSRTARAEAGWMLRLSPYAPSLSRVLCDELLRPAGHRYEHQRSMVRLVGALGRPDAAATLFAIASDRGRERTVALTAAWDLAGVASPGTAPDLSRVYDLYPDDASVRRAAVTAAARLAQRELLLVARADPDGQVRGEASSWLSTGTPA